MSSVPEALAEAARREPDLASYYELHAKLFELQDKARGELAARLELADQPALQVRLLQGRSQLSFAQLPLEAGRFAKLSLAIAMALKEYYAPDRVVEQTLPANIAGWFSLAQRRFEDGCASPEKRDGRMELTLAEMTVDQALKPYLAWAAEQVLPHLDQRQWLRTYCPACGGLPDFAFLAKEAGDRYLVCSRCNSQWLYRRLGCPSAILKMTPRSFIIPVKTKSIASMCAMHAIAISRRWTCDRPRRVCWQWSNASPPSPWT